MKTERQIKQDISYTQNFRDVADVLSVIASSYYSKLNRLYFGTDIAPGISLVVNKVFDLFKYINVTALISDSNITIENKILLFVSCDQGFCGTFNEDLKKYYFANNYLHDFNEIVVYGKQLKLGTNDVQIKTKNNTFDIKYILNCNIDGWDTFDTSMLFKNSNSSIDSNPYSLLSNISQNTQFKVLYCKLDAKTKKNVVLEDDIYVFNLPDEYGTNEQSFNNYLDSKNEVIADPNPKTFFSNLFRIYNEYKILDVFLNSAVAENYKRMNTMNQAKDEIENIMKQLKLQLQKQRQARITGELIELMNAFSNLKKSAKVKMLKGL